MGKTAGEIEGGIRVALRLCSLEARGLWTEMRYLIDESNAAGFLRQAGRPMTPLQLARVAGCDAAAVAPLLRELEDAGLVNQRDRASFSEPLASLAKIRASGAERVRKCKAKNRAKNGGEVLANTPGNAEVTPPIHAKGSPPGFSPTPPLPNPSPKSPSSGEAVGVEVKPARRTPATPHAELIEHFVTAWAAKYGRPYPFAGGRDGAAMRVIIAGCGGSMDDVRAAVVRFLADDGDFFTGHRLTLLAGQLTRFMVDAPRGRPAWKGHGNGRHRPTENDIPHNAASLPLVVEHFD